jgi:hypothetical protein
MSYENLLGLPTLPTLNRSSKSPIPMLVPGKSLTFQALQATHVAAATHTELPDLVGGELLLPAHSPQRRIGRTVGASRPQMPAKIRALMDFLVERRQELAPPQPLRVAADVRRVRRRHGSSRRKSVSSD